MHGHGVSPGRTNGVYCKASSAQVNTLLWWTQDGCEKQVQRLSGACLLSSPVPLVRTSVTATANRLTADVHASCMLVR